MGKVYRDDGEHWSEFATLLNAGIAGARDGAPPDRQPSIMIHIDRGGDRWGARYFMDHLLAQDVQFDIIGLSYYPFWHGPLADLRLTLTDLATRYGKDILIAETSYPWTLANGDRLDNFVTSAEQLPEAERFPPTPEGQAAYFEALRSLLLQVPKEHGIGYLAWEPAWLPGVGWRTGAGNQYDNLTMFGWDGVALPSVRAFREKAA